VTFEAEVGAVGVDEAMLMGEDRSSMLAQLVISCSPEVVRTINISEI
jgi:hypothetical protein